MVTALPAAFAQAACCFDHAIMATRHDILSANCCSATDRECALHEIADMMRRLKSEARAAIGRFATSDLPGHRATADACRRRMADAVNLHRAAIRCIRHGSVPPLPAMHAGRVSPVDPAPPPVRNGHAFWPMVWIDVLTGAWVF